MFLYQMAGLELPPDLRNLPPKWHAPCAGGAAAPFLEPCATISGPLESLERWRTGTASTSWCPTWTGSWTWWRASFPSSPSWKPKHCWLAAGMRPQRMLCWLSAVPWPAACCRHRRLTLAGPDPDAGFGAASQLLDDPGFWRADPDMGAAAAPPAAAQGPRRGRKPGRALGCSEAAHQPAGGGLRGAGPRSPGAVELAAGPLQGRRESRRANVNRAFTAQVIARTFSGDELARALGVWSALGGAGAALGVLVGGVLTAGPGWPSMFFVNVPVGVLLLVCLAWWVRPLPARGGRLDPAGAALVTAATAASSTDWSLPATTAGSASRRWSRSQRDCSVTCCSGAASAAPSSRWLIPPCSGGGQWSWASA